MFKQFYTIFSKELYSYFNTNLAYVLLSTYILLSMAANFFVSDFFNMDNIDLFSFFYFQSYIFIVLIPAFTMRQWSEERKSGSIEFLLTQPISLLTIVLGKFLAAWILCIIMLSISLPFWIDMNLNFKLDNLNILSAYLGCILVAGVFCAVGCMVSSFNNSPISSYIITLFVLSGICFSNFGAIFKLFPFNNEISPLIIQSLNFNKHFYDMLLGQISFDNILYFFSLIFLSLWLNVASIEYKKS